MEYCTSLLQVCREAVRCALLWRSVPVEAIPLKRYMSDLLHREQLKLLQLCADCVLARRCTEVERGASASSM